MFLWFKSYSMISSLASCLASSTALFAWRMSLNSGCLTATLSPGNTGRSSSPRTTTSRPATRAHELYDVADDPEEVRDLAGTPLEADMADLLHAALAELGAPDDQLVRLALR